MYTESIAAYKKKPKSLINDLRYSYVLNKYFIFVLRRKNVCKQPNSSKNKKAIKEKDMVLKSCLTLTYYFILKC